MIHPNNIKFSINDYDYKGELSEAGIYLHFDETRVRVAKSFEDFKSIVSCMQRMVDEISEDLGEKSHDETSNIRPCPTCGRE